MTKFGGFVLALLTLLAGLLVVSDLRGTDDLRGIASFIVILIYVPAAVTVVAVDYIVRSLRRTRRLVQEVARQRE